MRAFRKPSKAKSAITTTTTATATATTTTTATAVAAAAASHEGEYCSWGKHSPDGNWNGHKGGQGCSRAGYYHLPSPLRP